MPNQPKTPGHTVRVPDDEWIPARDKAAEEGETMTDVIRAGLRRYVLGALIVACFVGGGYLASGVHTSAPVPTSTVDQNQVWNDLQQRREQLQRDLQPQGPAVPTPAPTRETERSV